MMLFCGDPHGDFDQVLLAAGRYPVASVILLGDMEPNRPLSIELEPILNRVWWVSGNHDTDSIDLFDRTLGDHQIADRCIDGRVVTLSSGVRLAGLGGVFRQSVWHPDLPVEPIFRDREKHAQGTPRQDRFRGGVHLRHHSTIYPATIDRLASMRADVLVTHEAPGYHPHGFEILDTLAQVMGVKLTVHGHHHDHLDSRARWPSQGFASVGVGLRGVSLIDLHGTEKVVVEGQQDVARSHRKIEV